MSPAYSVPSLLISVILYSINVEAVPRHQLLKLSPSVAKHLDSINMLQKECPYDLDFWTVPYKIGVAVDLRITPESGEFVKNFLLSHDVPHEVIIDDLEEAIKDHFQDSVYDKHNAQLLGQIFCDPTTTCCDQYLDYDDFVAWMQDLADKYVFANLRVIGHTFEGRSIYALEFDMHPDTQKPHIALDGGIHAREWMSVGTVSHLAARLAKAYGRDRRWSDLVSRFSWSFIPIVNPDGYAYSFSHNPDRRMWRKNREPNAHSTCVGVDLCRNSDAGFGGPGSQSSPCSDQYHGKHAFSALETQALRDYYGSHIERTRAYINFHAYGELLLMAYGYTGRKCDDHDQILTVSRRVAQAMERVSGSVYQVGPAYTTIYPASGIMADHMFDAGVKYSFSCELRPRMNEDPGFLMPSAEICASVDEIQAGLRVLMEQILEEWESEQTRKRP
eukprot:174734_1